jgi:CBS domain containing-hemolysin-like protein
VADSAPFLSPAAAAWIAVLLGPLAALFSVLSALLERSGPIRLRQWVEEAGGSLRSLFEAPLRFGVFRYLLSLSARVLPLGAFAAVGSLLTALRLAHPWALALALMVLFVAAVEMLNRILVHRDPESALRILTYAYRGALFLFMPLVVGLSRLVPAPRRDRDREDDPEEGATDEEIEAFIDVGTKEGILEPEEGAWVWGIVGFAEKQVRSVMTPRIDLVCAPVDASLDELADRFVESAHSRLPVYQDSIDHVVGTLHIRDLLRALRDPERPDVRSFLKPPLFVPETKPLDELLRDLRDRYQQVAVVVDEYGGTSGLVTLEDLMEEIVGEIKDEHEALAADLEPLADGVFRLDGRAHLELRDDLFHVDIVGAEVETVAGLVFNAFGRVPQDGETVDSHGLRFTVERVADRRIQTVRVERAPVGVVPVEEEE